MSEQHTATPWFYQEDSDAYTHIVRPVQNRGQIVVQLRQDTSGRAEADARFIVRACNSHDDLVKALQQIEALAPSHIEKIASAALAKAGA